MKKTLILLVNLSFAYSLLGQLDTIYSSNGIIAVQIKEVLPDMVKFIYPDEDITHSIYKNTIQKIVYKSGRTESFNDVLGLNKVAGAKDWEKVSISRLESELKGLYKIDEVSSKSKGATALSNVDKVKDRSYKKLKIEAAMLGANIIYLLEESVQGNVFGNEYQAAQPTETFLTGIAYSSTKPKFSDFSSIIAKNGWVRYDKKQWLGRNSTDLQETNENLPPTVLLTNPTEENGFIFVNATIKSEKTNKFRVSYFDENKIILVYKDKKRIYNLVMEIFRK